MRIRLPAPLRLDDVEQPLRPLLVLFGLNLVDEFDRVAFAALTPEIRDAFDLADDQIVAIGAVSAVFILFGALPLGYLGDRVARVRIAGVAAAVWGSMAVLTGLAFAVPVLFAARLFSGVARTSNEVVHPSLLADLYPPAVQPRIFQVHRMATPLSAGAALLAGGIGAAFGWRAAFVVLAVPTFVLCLFLTRLREPRRGQHVGGAADDDFTPVPFAVARQQIFASRSLRRSWAGGFFLGAAIIANSQLLSLFFEDVHGFGPLGRGIVQFAYGAGIVVGIFVGAHFAMRATRTGRFAQLAVVNGISFVQFAVSLALLAATPWSGPSVLIVLLIGIGLGVYQPAYFPLVARIVPAAVRTQAYGWTLLFVGVGGLLSIPLARLGEQVSYRWAFVVLATIVAVGGAVVASARHFVDADVERADAAALAVAS